MADPAPTPQTPTITPHTTPHNSPAPPRRKGDADNAVKVM
eukprot:gene15443-805_t